MEAMTLTSGTYDAHRMIDWKCCSAVVIAFRAFDGLAKRTYAEGEIVVNSFNDSELM